MEWNAGGGADAGGCYLALCMLSVQWGRVMGLAIINFRVAPPARYICLLTQVDTFAKWYFGRGPATSTKAVDGPWGSQHTCYGSGQYEHFEARKRERAAIRAGYKSAAAAATQ